MTKTLALVGSGVKTLRLRLPSGARLREPQHEPASAEALPPRRISSSSDSGTPAESGTGAETSMPVAGAHRAVLLVATLGLFWPLLSAWGDIVSFPSAGVAVIAMIGAALWLACAIASAEDEAALARLDVAVLVLGLLVLLAYASAKLDTSSGYSSDEAAFEHGAALLLLHGHDPYGVNLLSSLTGFSVPVKYATYTMSGGIVSTLGYPAFPVVLTAFLVEATGSGQAVALGSVLALMVATVLVFKVLPAGWRALAAVVCIGFPTLSSFALGGMNTITMMAALVVVASRWTSIGERGGLSRRDYASAVACGVALATNQLSWFIAPFLLVGIFLTRRGQFRPRLALKLTTAYTGAALATFLVINLPFVVWDPGAWLQGVLAPLTQHAIPYGQGIVGLTLFLRLGGGALDAFGYAAGLTYLALLLLYAVRFRWLARCCFLFPSIVLFISGRSLAGYWMMLIAVVLVGVLTAEDSAIRRATQLGDRWRWRTRRVPRALYGAIFVPALIALAVALGTRPPLTMHVLSARSDNSARSVFRLLISAHNRTGATIRPHFAINAAGQATAFWRVEQGPRVLAAHATASYVLGAPDASSMPPNGTPFVVEAVADSPRTISSTVPFTQLGPVPGNW